MLSDPSCTDVHMLHLLLQMDEGRINLNVWLDQAVQPINVCGDSASRNPLDEGAEWDGVIIGDDCDAVLLEVVKCYENE